MKGTTLLFLIAACSLASAQNRISGRVVDAVTGEPLPSANAFFAGTTIGNSTTLDGWFTINGFANGKYDFTVSFVGYAMYQQSYNFTGNEKVRLLIKLNPDTQQLSAVVVSAKGQDRKANYSTFKRLFLGESKQAKECEILNPDDIYLYRDIDEGTLTAHSAKPIIVENKSLGYRIQYYLVMFQYEFLSGRLDVYGVPQFEEMKPKDDKKKRAWEKNRAEAYMGSVIHFMRSLTNNKLVENLFNVTRVYRVFDPDHPTKEFLEGKIDSLETLEKTPRSPTAEWKREGGTSWEIKNELARYRRLLTLPPLKDSVVYGPIGGHELLNPDTLSQVSFTGRLHIVFDERYEDTKKGRQYVKFGLRSDVEVYSKFSVYENGYYDNLGNMLIEGYWSTSEKLPFMLPLEWGTSPPLVSPRE